MGVSVRAAGPGAGASGYRDYSDRDVEVAHRIRQLLDAGLSTATIRTVLPCPAERAGALAPICRGSIEDLQRAQARVEAPIEALTRSRDAVSAVVAAGVTAHGWDPRSATVRGLNRR